LREAREKRIQPPLPKKQPAQKGGLFFCVADIF
jgi:hypothetical protein